VIAFVVGGGRIAAIVEAMHRAHLQALDALRRAPLR